MEDDPQFQENLCSDLEQSEVSGAGKDLSRNLGKSATQDTESATEDIEHEEAGQMEGNGVESYGKGNEIKEIPRKTLIGETKPGNKDKIQIGLCAFFVNPII